MKSQLFATITTLLITFICHSQTKFEKGYFIANNGKKTTCLIKNIGWKDSPTKFEYKLTENDNEKIATIETVKEFSVGGDFKYKRFTVQMDLYIDHANKQNLDNEAKPKYVEKTLFLQTLVEGKATLYLYDKSSYWKFFYSLDQEVPKQLFYKKYMLNSYTIKENNQYKQELYNNLKCESISSEDVLNIGYFKNDLIKFFEKYNECTNSSFKTFENSSRTFFNLTLRPGININSLLVENGINSDRNVDFGKQTNFRFGIEAEVVLAFNNNKWSLLFEPTYKYFKAKKQLDIQSVNIDYSYLELPLGIRHYFYLSDKSKVFVNALYIVKDLNSDAKLDYEFIPQNDFEVDTNRSLAIGLGFKYGKRLSFEFRYFTNKALFNYNYIYSEYHNISFIAGYTIF